jgi:hypothetical protein
MQFEQLLDGRFQRLSRLPSQLLCDFGPPLAFGLDGICTIIVFLAFVFVVLVSIVVQFEVLEVEL